jgi:hypothetical protein
MDCHYILTDTRYPLTCMAINFTKAIIYVIFVQAFVNLPYL